MCGIGGIRKYGDSEIKSDEITTMLIALENRGTHATGLVLQNTDTPDELFIYKEPKPAWSFTASPQYKQFLEEHLKPTTQTVLLHTRAATVGNPFENKNNHPIYDGDFAIVHNGAASNHTWMFEQLKARRACDTDSDIIRAIFDRFGFTHEAVRNLSRLSGSGAIAAVKKGDLQHLFIGRSGNPLVYGLKKEEHGSKFMFASELQAIQKASRNFERWMGLWFREGRANISYLGLPDNTAYLMNGDDLEWRQELKITTSFHPPVYRNYETYHDKMTRWAEDERRRLEREKKTPVVVAEDAEEEEEVTTPTKVVSLLPARISSRGMHVGQCPACGSLNEKKDNADPWGVYHCFKCDANLGGLEVAN